MPQLLNLPTELILQVLICLPPSSIITCRLVNKHLNTVIRDSVALRYALALDAAQAEDSPRSTLSKASKLQALESSEKAWADLQVRFIKPVPVEYHQSGVYDLSSGVFFLSDVSRTLLYSMKLPTRKDEEIMWNEIRTKNPIVDIGLCVFEHNLIAFVTSSPRSETPGTPTSFDIEVELREISTDSPHRLAEKSTLYVMNSTLDKPAVAIEIVGKHLVLVLSFVPYNNPDRIFIFEWEKNIVKASFEAESGTYASLLFLNEEIFLLPNTKAGALDIFRIPATSTLESPVPILRLALPVLSPDHSFAHMSCRSEPNPISPMSVPKIKRRASACAAASGGDGLTGPEPQRAWLAKAEDALCLFDLIIHSNMLDFRLIDRLELLVHRRALVEVVETFERGKAEKVGNAPTPNETAALAALTSSHSAQTDHPEPNVVPWKSWSPDITSWASADELTTQWITTSAGQRIVRMRELDWDDDNDDYDDYEPEKEPYIVFDYNQAHVERARKWLEAQPEHMEVRVGASSSFFGLGLLAQEGAAKCTAGDEDVKGKDKAEDRDTQEGSSGVTALFVDGDNVDNGNGSDENADEDRQVRGRRYQIDMEYDPDDELQEEEEDEASVKDGAFPQYWHDHNIEMGPHPFESTWSIAHVDYGGAVWEGVSDMSSRSGVSSQPRALDWRRPPPGAVYWVPAGEVFVPEGIFAEPVISGLPYVARVSRECYRYHGVMLDEERVIGTSSKVGLGTLGHIEKIEIHHFG